MEVVNELLGYKKYKIYQNPELFSFSIDSLLLASFCKVNKKTKNIIDLCSGNAPIPMYLTLRTNSFIDAVEIQKISYELGMKSIKENNLSNQINLMNNDLIGIHKILKKKYDLVTVNPPYFKTKDETRYNDSDYKTVARHEVLVNLEQVIEEGKKLLNNNGYMCMIHRPSRLSEIILLMKKHKLVIRRIRFVHPFKEKEANMVLIESRLSQNDENLIVEKPLIIYNKENEYNEKIVSIFNYKKEE